MTNEEINQLVEKYFKKENYEFPPDFEHRYDVDSSAITYSFIREFKPQTVLHIGTWLGGSVCVIMAALLKNKNKFIYIASELLDDMRQETYRHCFQKNGMTPMLIGDITKNLDKIPNDIDYLFVDTNHDLETTKWIIKNIYPKFKLGAIMNMHDWAVWEENGKWFGKGENGRGGTEETEYMLELHKKNKLPLQKIFWTYRQPGLENRESAWFIWDEKTK